jgi:hypothetical protein
MYGVSEQTFISAKWLISCREVAGILISGHLQEKEGDQRQTTNVKE